MKNTYVRNAAVFVTAIFCLSGCGKKTETPPVKSAASYPLPDPPLVATCKPGIPGGRLVMALYGDPKTYNPITANEQSSEEIYRNMFSALLGFDCSNRLFAWDDATKNTLLYPSDFTDLALGEGYTAWIDLGQAHAPSYAGTHAVTEFSMKLYQGWNWIGVPSSSDVSVYDLTVSVGDSTRSVTTDSGSADPWVNWNWVWWDPIDRTAEVVGPSSSAVDDRFLHPWYGYRVWANVDGVTITFPSG